MPRIRVLPPELISRIAAGECVERPASVIKELVENALDAGAGRIDVRTMDGGRELIQVVDDGGGMDRDDLCLCVTQHATSKIADDDDLFNIHTMGFRGEALASIGAVARLEITSRRPESDVGHMIRVDAGKMSEPKPVAAKPGTTVEARDLFHAVPARRKFLRTNQTESGHITEQFCRLALAQCGVAFSLRSQNRVVHELQPVNDRRQRIADLYGAELADVLIPIRREGGGVLVEGYVAPPAESRGSGKWEYVFVNGRYVRDRFVSHAIKEAYRSLIDPRRYPVAFVFITINPDVVDVNVHPMKTEIRWRDSNYVHGQVLAALRDKFLSTNLDHGFQATREDDAYRDRVRKAMVDFFTQSRSGPAPVHHGAASAGPRTTQEDAGEMPGRAESAPGASTPGVESTTPPPSLSRGDFAPLIPGLEEAAAPEAHVSRALQVHNAFIVAETVDGLMIIDQ
ncbi:MAG: DNA mismatch repair endonuclease MutL, partial [Phycisphaerae bacterium]|nr:DNA mismatch repair endonuclease MutL [Phycisphaerae bacterium]